MSKKDNTTDLEQIIREYVLQHTPKSIADDLVEKIVEETMKIIDIDVSGYGLNPLYVWEEIMMEHLRKYLKYREYKELM